MKTRKVNKKACVKSNSKKYLGIKPVTVSMVIDQAVSAGDDVGASGEAYADLIIFCGLHTNISDEHT